MKKNLFIASIIVIIVAIGYGGYYYLSQRQDTTVNPEYFKKPEVVIKNYVLGGKVTSILDNRITVIVTISTTTKNGVIETRDETKVAAVGSTTVFYTTKYANRKYTKNSAKFSDVKAGDVISMYSNSNIVEMKSFVPYRIDISK